MPLLPVVSALPPPLPYPNITSIDLAPSLASNGTSSILHVVCAWPVSGQYGPGTRVLYYALIAACLIARRAEWLVNACLAAALLLPAVAATHGIVLAALHVENAVDMDIYGAFQLCSIGILAAPVTVMMSRTYFNDPGRNTIFIWILLILFGLVCLAVEFYRAETAPCRTTAFGEPVTSNFSAFLWGNESSCDLKFSCSVEKSSPVSPMRGGAADNVYIIPAPSRLSFGTATLLAAACCIHAILCLISMWNKILENNWKRRSIQDNQSDTASDEAVDGSYRATRSVMKGINGRVQYFLSIAAIPVFGGVGLTVLAVGECNLWSRQMKYETESIASVGQWAPICGTFMAVVGSLYALLVADVEAVKEEMHTGIPGAECGCPHRRDTGGSQRSETRSRPRSISSHSSKSPLGHFRRNSRRRRNSSLSTARTMTRGTLSSETGSVMKSHHGSRHKVAETLITIGEWLGNPTRDYYDESAFKRGKAQRYPEIPGEDQRNSKLSAIRQRNSERLVAKENKASSVAGSIAPSEASHHSSDVHLPHIAESRDAVFEEHPMELEGVHGGTSNAANIPLGGRPRRDTLEVPPPVHHH